MEVLDNLVEVAEAAIVVVVRAISLVEEEAVLGLEIKTVVMVVYGVVVEVRALLHGLEDKVGMVVLMVVEVVEEFLM